MKALLITVLTSMALMIAMPQVAIAQGINDEDANRACEAFREGGCTEPAGEGFTDIWENIINIATFAVGLVSVLLVLIGGLRYVLSSGDPQGTAGAKNTIIYAIVGLVIAVAARAIVLFVLDRL